MRCKYCESGNSPEYSEHAKVWIHRLPRLDKKCTERFESKAEFLHSTMTTPESKAAKLSEEDVRKAKLFLEDIYDWANTMGDKVDPKRTHERTLGREFTKLAQVANMMRVYLEGGVRQ